MPRVYVRKANAPARATWTEEQLKQAITKLKSNEVGLNAVSKQYGISKKTLLRRYRSGDLTKRGLGPPPMLGFEHERRLVAHIKRLAVAGFAPDRALVKSIAFQFAEKLNIQHRFSQEKKMAGYDWLKSFLQRNADLSIRKGEGLSVAIGQGLNRQSVALFYEVLRNELVKHNLEKMPQSIYTMDESGIQLINKPGSVIAGKGSKDVHVVTSKEKGESVTVVACNNAEGHFLPPVLIIKAKNKKTAFEKDLPPGSKVYMNQKSSYMNSDIFMLWLKEHFVPRKSPGKCILLLDGHASHCNDPDMLEFADANDIIILCLPGHTTNALQPLDKSFFHAFKTYYNQTTKDWMLSNKERNISRNEVGKLVSKAWQKSATVRNAISGFRACGIYPFDTHAIPDHFFSVSDYAAQQRLTEITETTTPESTRTIDSPISENSTTPSSPIASTSGIQNSFIFPSPSKSLQEIMPIPVVPTPKGAKRNVANVLTSEENIKKRQLLKAVKQEKIEKALERNIKRQSGPHAAQIIPRKHETKKVESKTISKKGNKEKSKNITKNKSIKTDEDSEDNCNECLEDYKSTTSTVDWIRCPECSKWLHETCTMYPPLCNMCGREKKRMEVGRRGYQ